MGAVGGQRRTRRDGRFIVPGIRGEIIEQLGIVVDPAALIVIPQEVEVEPADLEIVAPPELVVGVVVADHGVLPPAGRRAGAAGSGYPRDDLRRRLAIFDLQGPVVGAVILAERGNRQLEHFTPGQEEVDSGVPLDGPALDREQVQPDLQAAGAHDATVEHLGVEPSDGSQRPPEQEIADPFFETGHLHVGPTVEQGRVEAQLELSLPLGTDAGIRHGVRETEGWHARDVDTRQLAELEAVVGLVARLPHRGPQLQLVHARQRLGEPVRGGRLGIKEQLTGVAVVAALIRSAAGRQQQPVMDEDLFLREKT